MMSRKAMARSGLRWLMKSLVGKTKKGALEAHVAWLEGELRGLGLFKAWKPQDGAQSVTVRVEAPAADTGDSLAMEGPVTYTIDSAVEVVAGSVQEWVWRKGEKIPLERAAVAAPVPAPEKPAAEPAAVVDGWPRECELVIEGYPLNPKLMIGRLYGEEGGQAFRRVSLWRVRGRNLRPGMRVACRLDRGGANPVYLPV